MAIYNPEPLSWSERIELAQNLRKQAAELLDEACHMEEAVESDKRMIRSEINKMFAEGGLDETVSY